MSEVRAGNGKLVTLTLLGVLMVLGLIAGQCSGWSGSSGDGSVAVTRFMAVSICEDAVKNRLRAPATAQFPDPLAIPESGNRWRVQGAVDAQNAFGALVRSDYECHAWLDADGDTVRGRVVSMVQR